MSDNIIRNPDPEAVTPTYEYRRGDALLCIDCFKLITGSKVASNPFVQAHKNPPCGTCGGVMVLTTEQAVEQAIKEGQFRD